jgi:hypothetical protein
VDYVSREENFTLLSETGMLAAQNLPVNRRQVPACDLRPEELIGELISLLAIGYRRFIYTRQSQRHPLLAGVAGPEAKSVHGGIE